MNINYDNNGNSTQQTAYNENNPATPVADDHTYRTMWYEPAELENQAKAVVKNLTSQDNSDCDFSIVDNPLLPSVDVRELPVYALPPHFQTIIDNVVEAYQCSRDFVVASMFSAVASILGKRVKYKFCSYTNFPALWLVIVGNSASGKTSPLSFFFKPIDEMERQSYESYMTAKKEWDKQDELSRGDKPEFYHNIINNPTDEAVLNELAINGSVCWKVDEFRTMFTFGKYSNGNNNAIVGNLLSIFNNADITISRATKEPKYLKEPNLNIVGTTQPSTLKKIFKNSGFVDDGLFQRFLFVYPEDCDVPMFSNKRISDEAIMEWSHVIKILHCESGEVVESAEAESVHIEAINRWREMINTDYKGIDPMVALVRKLEIHLCRLAIIVTVLCGDKTITPQIMKYCVECMEYFRLCGEKAYCFIKNEDTSPTLTNGKLLDIIKEKHPDWSQPKLAEVVGISQQAVSKHFKKRELY